MSGSDTRVGRRRRKATVETALDGEEVGANSREDVVDDAAEWFKGGRRGHGTRNGGFLSGDVGRRSGTEGVLG